MKQDSWLYSDSFFKRAFAIWGHYFVANLIIAGIFMIIIFSLAFINIFTTFWDSEGAVRSFFSESQVQMQVQ